VGLAVAQAMSHRLQWFIQAYIPPRGMIHFTLTFLLNDDVILQYFTLRPLIDKWQPWPDDLRELIYYCVSRTKQDPFT